MRRLLALLLAASAMAATPVDDPKWTGHERAPEDYRATEEDFKVFERGLTDAAKVEPRLFPKGIVGIDAVLYDTGTLYIYSRSRSYPLPKWRRRAGYQVYRVPVEGRPEAHEMAICMGGLGPASVEVKRIVTERSYACAPWGMFARIQRIRRSDYRFQEGYWASMIHEYGHQYQDKLAADPSPEMTSIERAIAAAELPAGTDRGKAAGEGYATWCELAASRTLYPGHFRRLMERAREHAHDDDLYGHEAGLRAAAALFVKP